MLVLFLSFAKSLYLGLEVFQVLFFTFSESTLGSSVLSLAFLLHCQLHSIGAVHEKVTYSSRFRG